MVRRLELITISRKQGKTTVADLNNEAGFSPGFTLMGGTRIDEMAVTVRAHVLLRPEMAYKIGLSRGPEVNSSGGGNRVNHILTRLFPLIRKDARFRSRLPTAFADSILDAGNVGSGNRCPIPIDEFAFHRSKWIDRNP